MAIWIRSRYNAEISAEEVVTRPQALDFAA
jgi:hypothetical protein